MRTYPKVGWQSRPSTLRMAATLVAETACFLALFVGGPLLIWMLAGAPS